MAYNITSCRVYPFHRENAKFFSQELIEYVFFDMGHMWEAKRSKRECQLRKDALYTFTPCIGRLVTYVSRKYGGFIVSKCFSNWKYIHSHREFMRARMLCNEIVAFCTRSDLETDDLGLFTFMAMMVEYARLVYTNGQEDLIGSIVDALTFCLTSRIPGGFVVTVERMQKRAENFEYPRSYVVKKGKQSKKDDDPESSSASSESSIATETDSVFTSKSYFETPPLYESSLPSTTYDTPMEEIEEEFNKREMHREMFRRRKMVDIATQVELEDDDKISPLECSMMKVEEIELVVKMEITKDEQSDECDLKANHLLVERNDVYIQTSPVTDEHCHDLEDNEKYSLRRSEISSVDSSLIDLKAVIDKLNDIQNLRIEDDKRRSSTYACSTDIYNSNLEDESKDCRTQSKTDISSDSMSYPDFNHKNSKDFNSLGKYKNVDDGSSNHKNSDNLEVLKVKADPSESRICGNNSLNDSLVESANESFDLHPRSNEEDIPSKMTDDGFDSQLESLDKSISEGSHSES